MSLTLEPISSATSHPSVRAFPECGSARGASSCFCKSLSPQPFPLHPHPKSEGRFSSCFATVWSVLPGPSSPLQSFSGPGMQQGVGPSAAKAGSGSLGQQLHFWPQPQRQPLLHVQPAPEHTKLKCLYRHGWLRLHQKARQSLHLHVGAVLPCR